MPWLAKKRSSSKRASRSSLSETKQFLHSRQLKLPGPSGSNQKALAVANINSSLLSRPKPQRRRQIALKRIGMVSTLLLVLVGFIGYAYSTEAWKVTTVEVSGELNVLSPKAKELEQELMGQNLLTIRTSQYTQRLRQDPYVEEVFIRKQYPGKIEINITEAKPELKLISLSGLSLYERDGTELSQQAYGDNIPLSEVERLMYVNPNVFKSEMLRDIWRAREAESLRREFESLRDDIDKRGDSQSPDPQDVNLQEEKIEQLERDLEKQWRDDSSYELSTAIEYILLSDNIPEKHRVTDEADSLRAIQTGLQPLYFNQNFENPEQKAFEYFVDITFRRIEARQLESLYEREREQVQLTVSQRLGEVEQGLAAEKSTPIKVYSLLPAEEILDFDDIIEAGFFQDLTEYFDQSGQPLRFEFVNPSTVSVQTDGKTYIFSTRKEVGEQLLQLDAVLLKLQVDEKEYNRINLTGEKIVVS